MFGNKTVPDVVAGFIAILFGALSILEAVRLYPTKNSVMSGDHTMPALLGAAMIILGTLLVFFINGERFKPQFPEKSTLRVLIGILVVLFGNWILMDYLGYILSTLVAALFLFRLTGSYSWIKSTVFALVTTAVIYIIFIFGLNMVLPEGLL
jgi:putative tricarboxylic transport membrane protein